MRYRTKYGSNWAATASFYKSRLQYVLSNVPYSPSHRQTGAPTINIRSTLRSAPICVKMALLYYLVATVIHIQSARCQICVCVCVYTYCAQYGDGGRAKERKNIGTAVNAACQVNPSSCHFGHACHTFDTPGPKTMANCTQQRRGKRNRVAKLCFALRPSYHMMALVLREYHAQLLPFLEDCASHLSTGTGYPSPR
jgi:hypothetical protein